MDTQYKKHVTLAGTVALVCVSFAAISSGLLDLKSAKYPNGQVASITVSGEGEVTSLPDIATVSFTIREQAKTVPEAQKLAETKIADAMKELKALKVDEKDIKTLSYTVNPRYETQNSYCNGYMCPPVKSVITGYEVTQSVQVKIRKIDDAGLAIGALGKVNITEISGPDFAVDEPEKAQAEAKAKAIKQAQEKALATARALGVGLGSITQYSEDNGGYYPVMYRAEAMSMKVGGASDAVTLPQGESVIKARVTITYSLD